MDGNLPHTPASGRVPLQMSFAASEARVCEAQQMFHRTLSGWASDLLLLRQRRLRHPAWCEGQMQADGWSKAA